MVNAQVADPSLSLEIPQGAQLSVHAPEIVDLHQIQPVGPQGAERIVDPLEAFLAVFAIHLGGHKQLIPDPQFRYQVPDHSFRVAVAGGRVNQLPAAIGKRLQSGLERGAFGQVVSHSIVARAQTDHRHGFPGGGNGASNQPG